MARTIDELVDSLPTDRRRRIGERARVLISEELSLQQSARNGEIKPMSEPGDSDAAQRSKFSAEQRTKSD